jgi:thioredoxin 1
MNIKSKDQFTNLIEKVSYEKPVLFDFYAEWCGPCKALSPIIDTIGEELGDNAAIFKIDVDEFYEIADSLGVRGMPTIIIYRNGGILHQVSGLISKDKILEMLK